MPESLTSAHPMRSLVTLATSLTLAAGCASSVPDPFAGTYRFVDPKERSYYVVTKVAENIWSAREVSTSEQSSSEAQPLSVASRSLVAEWFDAQSPRDRITCLATVGRYQSAFICQLPTGATFQLTSPMFSKRMQSKTGYVLVVGTPAGAIATDLSRSK